VEQVPTGPMTINLQHSDISHAQRLKADDAFIQLFRYSSVNRAARICGDACCQVYTLLTRHIVLQHKDEEALNCPKFPQHSTHA